MSNPFVKLTNNIKTKFEKFQELSYKDKKTLIGNYLLNNSLYIFMILAAIYIQIKEPIFLSMGTINNIIMLSAANLPIALGIAGAIILTRYRSLGWTGCRLNSYHHSFITPSCRIRGQDVLFFASAKHYRLASCLISWSHRRLGQRFLGSQIQSSSIYRYPSYPTYSFRRFTHLFNAE